MYGSHIIPNDCLSVHTKTLVLDKFTKNKEEKGVVDMHT